MAGRTHESNNIALNNVAFYEHYPEEHWYKINRDDVVQNVLKDSSKNAFLPEKMLQVKPSGKYIGTDDFSQTHDIHSEHEYKGRQLIYMSAWTMQEYDSDSDLETDSDSTRLEKPRREHETRRRSVGKAHALTVNKKIYGMKSRHEKIRQKSRLPDRKRPRVWVDDEEGYQASREVVDWLTYPIMNRRCESFSSSEDTDSDSCSEDSMSCSMESSSCSESSSSETRIGGDRSRKVKRIGRDRSREDKYAAKMLAMRKLVSETRIGGDRSREEKRIGRDRSGEDKYAAKRFARNRSSSELKILEEDQVSVESSTKREVRSEDSKRKRKKRKHKFEANTVTRTRLEVVMQHFQKIWGIVNPAKMATISALILFMIMQILALGFSPALTTNESCLITLALLAIIIHTKYRHKQKNQSIPRLLRSARHGKAFLMNKFFNTAHPVPHDLGLQVFAHKAKTRTDNRRHSSRKQRNKTIRDSRSDSDAQTITVPLSAERHFMPVNFDCGLQAEGLIDSGATSSAIELDLLQEIEAASGTKAPRLAKKYEVLSFNVPEPSKPLQVVLLNITLANGTRVKDAPFIVTTTKQQVKLIIGMNILNHRKIGFDKLKGLLAIFHPRKIMRHDKHTAIFNSEINYPLSMAEDLVLEPGQTKFVKLKFDGGTRAEHNLMGKPIRIFGLDSEANIVVSAITTLGRNNMCWSQLKNNTPEQMHILRGSDVAIMQLHESGEQVISIERMITLEQKYRKLRKLRSSCFCNMPPDTTRVAFASKFGFTHFQQHATDLKSHSLEPAARVITQGNYVILIANKNNSYAGIQNKQIKAITDRVGHKISVLLPLNSKPTAEMKDIICSLQDSTPTKVTVVLFKSDPKICLKCATCAADDLTSMLENTNSLRVHFACNKKQLGDYECRRDEKSPVRIYNLAGNWFKMFRSQHTLMVTIHLSQPDQSITKLALLLMHHLAMQHVPQKITVTCDEANFEAALPTQVAAAMKILPKWDERQINISSLQNNTRLEPYFIETCSCKACTALAKFEICPIEKSHMIFSGDKDMTFDQSTRVKIHAIEIAEKISIHFCDFAFNNEETFAEYNDLGPKEDWDEVGLSSEREDLEKFPTEIDVEKIMQNRHVPQDWRKAIDPETLDAEVRQDIIAILDRYNDCFSHQPYSWRFAKVDPISLKFADDEPIIAKPISMSPLREQILSEKIQSLIDCDLVEILPFDPQYVCNVANSFIVSHNSSHKENIKQANLNDSLTDPSYRIVLDLRAINQKLMHKKLKATRVPATDEILSRLGEFRHFILLDISKSFRSLQIDKASQYRTAFRANTAKFRSKILAFKSIPDGLSTSPGHLMETLMTAFEKKGMTNLSLFVDDLIIHCNTKKEAVETFRQVMEVIEELNLLIGIKKASILKPSFNILGWRCDLRPNDCPVISVPDERKKSFQLLQMPTTKLQLQKVLGTAAFVSAAIPNMYAEIGPLIDLLRVQNRANFKLSEIQQKTFKRLLVILDNCQTLKAFDYRVSTHLSADSSIGGGAAALMQFNNNGTLEVVKYYSKKWPLAISTGKSSIFKEALILFCAIKHFDLYLRHSIKVILYTDLACLISLLGAQYTASDATLLRMSHYIFSRNYPWRLKHCNGRELIISDTLSRIYDCPIKMTGAHFESEDAAKEFFKKYELSVPQTWKEGSEITYSELIAHFHDQIIKDKSLSKALREKRIAGLESQLTEPYLTELKLLKTTAEKSGEAKSRAVKLAPLHQEEKSLEVHFIEKLAFYATEIATPNNVPITPPRALSGITLESVIKWQAADEFCSNVMWQLRTKKAEEISKSVKNKFRLLDFNILVTRKSLKQPFSAENIRIYLGPKASLQVLVYYHLTLGHASVNPLVTAFSATFKTEGIYNLAKIARAACHACTIYHPYNKKFRSKARFPRAKYPGEVYFIDVLQLKPGFLDGEKVEQVLGIIDSFSSYAILIPMKDTTTNSIIKALSNLFAKIPVPKIIKLDNAAYFRSEVFQKKLKNMGVTHIWFSSPLTSEANSRIERLFRQARAGLFLNTKTFNRKSRWDCLYHTLAQLNMRPLHTLNAFKGKNEFAPSPFELFFNRKINESIIKQHINRFETLPPNQQEIYAQTYAQIIREYDKIADQKLQMDLQQRSIRDPLRVGDIVLLFAKNREKGTNAFLSEFFEITNISFAKASIRPMFNNTRKVLQVNMNHLKRLVSADLINELPKPLLTLLGHSYQPKDLRKMAKAGKTPTVLKERIDPYTLPNLRHRVAPKSVVSQVLSWDDPDEAEDEDYLHGISSENSDWDPNVRLVFGKSRKASIQSTQSSPTSNSDEPDTDPDDPGPQNPVTPVAGTPRNVQPVSSGARGQGLGARLIGGLLGLGKYAQSLLDGQSPTPNNRSSRSIQNRASEQKSRTPTAAFDVSRDQVFLTPSSANSSGIFSSAKAKTTTVRDKLNRSLRDWSDYLNKSPRNKAPRFKYDDFSKIIQDWQPGLPAQASTPDSTKPTPEATTVNIPSIISPKGMDYRSTGAIPKQNRNLNLDNSYQGPRPTAPPETEIANNDQNITALVDKVDKITLEAPKRNAQVKNAVRKPPLDKDNDQVEPRRSKRQTRPPNRYADESF